ncbi:hypothetical protein PRIPAC_76582 [Pristionchus pacificus]|uniref:Uncharacterized protein n=1 Tax=Pristionchus pacificus TaxID=54126 RepID=A0A2A6C6W9_PRIPA|nr:hypothetical protein PRIPAC_76582 [Pristionchus pacificus]|eukprot:PDM73771.1 hypothetical protein PRIPAC_41127 [Pristionchus pacificus]
MCTVIFATLLRNVDKLNQSRLFAVLIVLSAIYNLIVVCIHALPAWVIVCRSILLVLQIGATVAGFAAVYKRIPQLIFPIIGITIVFSLINFVMIIFAIIALADQHSFYGQFIREHYTNQHMSNEDRDSKVRTYAATSLVTSIVFLLICLRGLYVHFASYKILKERLSEAIQHQYTHQVATKTITKEFPEFY